MKREEQELLRCRTELGSSSDRRRSRCKSSEEEKGWPSPGRWGVAGRGCSAFWAGAVMFLFSLTTMGGCEQGEEDYIFIPKRPLSERTPPEGQGRKHAWVWSCWGRKWRWPGLGESVWQEDRTAALFETYLEVSITRNTDNWGRKRHPKRLSFFGLSFGVDGHTIHQEEKHSGKTL